MGRRITGFINPAGIIFFVLLISSCPNNLIEKIEEDITVSKAINILSSYPLPGEDDAFTDTKI